MFTKAEEALIQELREQKAPLERWGKFFPQHKIVDLMERPKEAKPVGYLYGKPMYVAGVVHDSVSYRIGEAPSGSYVPNPEAYARSMKKGNIYKWDDMQDAYLSRIAKDGWSIKKMIVGIKSNFGIERTTGAIESRLQSLGFILR